MAERGRGEMPNYLGQPVEAAVVDPERRDRLQHLLLDAGRMLLVCGAFAVVSTVGRYPGGANLAHALLGFVLWFVGVSLLALLPLAQRFPRAAPARIGAAVAKHVLNHFFPPWD